VKRKKDTSYSGFLEPHRRKEAKKHLHQNFMPFGEQVIYWFHGVLYYRHVFCHILGFVLV